MFVLIRESSYHPGAYEQGQAAREEFYALRAQQPGYRGSTVMDAGNEQTVTVTVWESEQAADAATTILQPQAERLLGPLWSSPSRVVYQGPIIGDESTAR